MIKEGRRTDGNRRRRTGTDGDGRRMFENKFYVTRRDYYDSRLILNIGCNLIIALFKKLVKAEINTK